MDKLNAMQLFVRVVDTGSFTAAAEQLDMSRAMASKLVRTLEQQLGVRLLNRTTRNLSLTGTGETYYQRATDILAQIAQAEAEADASQTQARGRLRVAAPMSFGVRHLAPALAQFQLRHPGIALDLRLNDRVIDLIEEGFDLAIRIGRLADSSLIARRLAPCRLVLVASPDYLKRHGTPVHPQDLAQHNCIGYSLAARRDEWTFQRDDNVVRMRTTGNLRVNNGDVIVRAASDGIGLAILPTFIAHTDIEQHRLVRVLDNWLIPELAIHAVYTHSRTLPAKTRTLIEFLGERFGPEPEWDKNSP